jgi:DNA-binding XRE family transcriptional regulator
MDGPHLLKLWRVETRNLSQEVAAEMVGVHQNTWSDWEHGHKAPRIEAAIRIAVVTDGACPIESWAKPVKRKPAKRMRPAKREAA